MTKQNKYLLIFSHILCTCIGIAFTTFVCIVTNSKPDFPEEIEALSVDQERPDTLTAYKGADNVIHFEYLNEQKNK